MSGGFVHHFNPVIVQLASVKLYYYGLAYAVGFAGIFGRLRLRRQSLGWKTFDVYDFSLLFVVCVLLMGRFFSVLVYHWAYYREHPDELFYYWRGGMATHGVLLGAVIAMTVYSRLRRVSFRRLADEVAIPAAFLLALGRVGNFINGQICGTVTSVWWAVKFPGIEGFRHPVTLYEAAKNLILIPILLAVGRKHKAGKGFVAAHFVFWYGFLRLFTDIFREHGSLFLGIGRNQYFNAMMAVLGLILMVVFSRINKREQVGVALTVDKLNPGKQRANQTTTTGMWVRRSVFALILLFSLVIRSAWTPEALEQKRRENHTLQFSELKKGSCRAAEGDF